jgi:hypothetical protein
VGQEMLFCPRNPLQIPPKSPQEKVGQVWGVSQGRSYLSYREDTLGTPEKIEFKATPMGVAGKLL